LPDFFPFRIQVPRNLLTRAFRNHSSSNTQTLAKGLFPLSPCPVLPV
jgi:hypothetical protein